MLGRPVRGDQHEQERLVASTTRQTIMWTPTPLSPPVSALVPVGASGHDVMAPATTERLG